MPEQSSRSPGAGSAPHRSLFLSEPRPQSGLDLSAGEGIVHRIAGMAVNISGFTSLAFQCFISCLGRLSQVSQGSGATGGGGGRLVESCEQRRLAGLSLGA